MAGIENGLKAKPEDIREQRQLKELQEAYGEAIIELLFRRSLRKLDSNLLTGGEQRVDVQTIL
jgi:hypothetical protein